MTEAMDTAKLNEDLIALVGRRNLLASLDYNDEAYDQVEEEMHDLEDDFIEKYGPYLEEAFRKVHQEHCPDEDVLLPIAYVAKKYIEKKDAEGNLIFGVGPNEGVIVDADQFPKAHVRLFLVPTPTRLVMTVNNRNPKVVWKAE
jgi:hypothetical protein